MSKSSAAVDLSDLIACIYDAAVTNERWPATLDAVTRHVGAVGCTLVVWDSIRNLPSLLELGGHFERQDEGERLYAEHYGKIDVYRKLVYNLSAGQAVLLDEQLDLTQNETREYINDFLIRCGSRFVLGGLICRKSELIASIGLHRGLAQGLFETANRARLQHLMPHLQRAVRLHHELIVLRHAEQRTAEILDRLSCGLLLTDEAGRIAYANSAAEEMLRAADGLISVRRRLSAAQADEARTLAQLIAQAGRRPGTGGAMRITRPSSQIAYAAVLVPITSRPPIFDMVGEATVLIMVSDPQTRAVAPEAELQHLFGLTQAEAGVARALVEGQTVEEIASVRGVRTPTIRTQVRGVLTKTETRRQSDLLRLLLSVPSVRRLSGGGESG